MRLVEADPGEGSAFRLTFHAPISLTPTTRNHS